MIDNDMIFTSKEYEEAYQTIKGLVTKNKTGVNEPVAIVLGGQPGAGKSSIYDIAMIRFEFNIVKLDCDKFRKYHPEAEKLCKSPETYGEKTNPFVFACVDRLADELSEEKYNMIIESSMKSSGAVTFYHGMLSPKGYKIEAQVMATPKEISWQGVVKRYEEELEKGGLARIVPKEFHDYVVEHIVDAIDEVYRSGMVSNIIIYNRKCEKLYDMRDTPDKNPKDILDARINKSTKGDRGMKDSEFDELVEKARHADLADYFRTSGYTLKKMGNELYVSEIKGLVINQNSNSWFSHYDGVGRINNSVDCLTMILDKSFKDAVYELTGQDLSHGYKKGTSTKSQASSSRPKVSVPKDENIKEKREMVMPDHAPTQRRVFAYLHSTRFIPNEIIREFVNDKILYQAECDIKGTLQGKEQIFKKANAVFVHTDDNGNEIGGEIQGLDINKRYKGMVAGTGESFFKFVPVKDVKPVRAFIFESAIDLMSFYSMCTDKSKLKGTMFVSMAGLKPHVPRQLREQGIHVISAVDNDNAGRKFEKENELSRSDFVTEKLDIHGFKDWNERLEYQTKHPNFLVDERKIIQEHREKIAQEHSQEMKNGRN